ncbi:DUF397 domain-containing protein [Glycomyces sp. A-F 0318]|uniref:DUF397 domain-containing protein n=1 Tax=Glycomyces amatae TaxID=2881355 RepID=UPI001E46C426|nr:DUF397 domain-containing protein [Glycomyces amatae]MCD0444872.1 DUF397 domain-containing protein [Glycomyces amatae]
MLTEEWRKSSRSGNNTNQNCLEARIAPGLASEWRKSSRSGNNTNQQCVEARSLPHVVQVRDTKLGEDSPILDASPADWRGFLSAVAK